MAVSGFLIYFYQGLHISKEFAHEIKEIHELTMYFIIFFIASHIAGVVTADNSEEKGIVSSMINGKDF